MTSAIFAFAGLIALGAAFILATFGWAVAMPDGVTRFEYRLWAWISMTAFFACSFASGDRRWWNWALTSVSLFCCLSRIERWWRQLELVRRFEREVARGTTRRLP